MRLYVYKIWGGNPLSQNLAENEFLQKFDFQFLDAIRDVERDMLSGKNNLLRDVLDFFMDYEIKSLSDTSKSKEEKADEIKKRKSAFSNKADDLIAELQVRMKEGKNHILSYINDTGASFNKASPNFDGSISDIEMFSALKLIVEYETGIKIPATHNGLGYNNLIFMSLLLAKMQVDSDGNYLGNNAKMFPLLVIEEPEAHLHPSMQYKFLKFLRDNKDISKKVRQIFVTTHSTQITSAVSLDEIICLYNKNDETIIGYPGKVFQDDKSKKYVQRFLDATKSDMLFSHKVILVEGIAEQLLISIFAKYIGKSLEDNHIAVINVGGRFFDHFLYLFDSKKQNTIPKEIACITDIDPEKKDKQGNNKYEKCYPFEYAIDLANFDYQVNPALDKYPLDLSTNIRFFSQDPVKGKTFEYDLIINNPGLELLVTESMSNQSEIRDLMKYYREGKLVSDFLDRLSNTLDNNRIKKGINENSIWNDDDKKKAIIASRYLNSIGKGENALELAYTLEKNWNKKGNTDFQDFIVPNYLRQAIEYICQ